MKLLILGAGQVGSSAADHLSREESNEITVVDTKPKLLRDLQDRLDIRTILGNAAHPDVLEKAGAEEADVIIAVTDKDETNMLACHIAYTLFNTPTKIARIRADQYMRTKKLFSQNGLGLAVDVRISPEKLVCQHIEQLLHFPGAMQALEFADGKIRLVGARADKDGLLVGQ